MNRGRDARPGSTVVWTRPPITTGDAWPLHAFPWRPRDTEFFVAAANNDGFVPMSAEEQNSIIRFRFLFDGLMAVFRVPNPSFSFVFSRIGDLRSFYHQLATNERDSLFTVSVVETLHDISEHLGLGEAEWKRMYLCQSRVAQPSRKTTNRAISKAQVYDACKKHGIEAFHHITALENLEPICRKGLLSHNKAPRHADISDKSVQAIRHVKKIPQHPSLSIHDCVPLFIAARPPMLSARREKQAGIVYLHLDPLVLARPGAVFSDGNAAAGTTSFFDDLTQLADLDWSVLRAVYWGCDDDRERHKENKRRRSAEILIPHRIPIPFIRSVSVMTPRARDEAWKIITGNRINVPVHIDASLYYPMICDAGTGVTDLQW